MSQPLKVDESWYCFQPIYTKCYKCMFITSGFRQFVCLGGKFSISADLQSTIM